MAEETPQSRTVRVFVSSTFRDMREERDYLARVVFPELRSRCRQRQVEFVEVDLRWGITDEQAERGETLPRCLDIINTCRPYFIGILGERYGWVPHPEQIPAHLFKEQPWLMEHLECSITELEILHGVLNNPDMAEKAFFYFRDPLFAAQLSQSKKKHFVEESQPYRERLQRLKARIKAGKFRLKEGYRDLDDLGQLILNDLWSAIDETYPPLSTPTEIERLSTEHQAFTRNRSKLYVPRKGWHDRLDLYAENFKAPLAITGPSGIGKSALLAAWSLSYKERHPERFVLSHFVGVSPESAQPRTILRRILLEYARLNHLSQPVPDDPDELIQALTEFLKVAPPGQGIVLIIDALNQLEDLSEIHCLRWLPEIFPETVCLILSMTEGRYLDEIKRRGWPVWELAPADSAERIEMVASYLRYYGKDMDQSQIEELASVPQTSNPLFLRVLLDELRVTSWHTNLRTQLSGYLGSGDAAELLDMVMERWEKDYDHNREGLVQDALSSLAVSHRGLSERELLELLGDRENNLPLPQSYWSPFYVASADFLVNRSGYLWFFHDHLRRAIEARYLQDPDSRCDALFRLSDFYSGKISLDLEQGGVYRRLSLEVAEDAMAIADREGDERLRAQARLNCAGTLLSVGMGIGHAGSQHFSRMVDLLGQACELARLMGAWDILADGLVRRAGDETGLNPDFGRYDLIDEAIRLRSKHRDWEGVRDALRDKARIGMRLNQLDVTETSLLKADTVQGRIMQGDPQWPLIHRHQYWGECRALQGRWQEAIEHLTVALEGAQRFSHLDGINAATGWLGLAWCHLGNVRKGMRMVRRAMETERDKLQSLEVIGRWLVELAKFFDERQGFKRALHALWLSEMIYVELQHSALFRTREILRNFAERNATFCERLQKVFNPYRS